METPYRDEIAEVGVDYVTATNLERATFGSLPSFGSYLVDTEVSNGHKQRDFRWNSYVGRAAGSAAFGIRYDGSILRASGTVAAEHWQQIVSLSDNVSRFDVQVTVTPSEGPTRRLLRHRDELARAPRSRGRVVQFHYIGSNKGIETLTIGSRQSDRFMRIYDKHAESGLDHYRGMLRYEVEFKNETAKNQATYLDACERYQDHVVQWVFTLASIRGIQLARADWRPGSARDDLRAKALINKDSTWQHARAFAWARVSIRPWVQRMVQAGHLDDVLEALGLLDHVVQRQRKELEVWSMTTKRRKDE